MQLARDDLHDLDIARPANLVLQVEGALCRFRFPEIDFEMHIGRSEPPYHPVRAANQNLRLRDIFPADLQILRNIAKLDGHGNGQLGWLLTRNGQPQAHSQRQGNQFQEEIVEHIAAKEVAHGYRSTPECSPGSILRGTDARGVASASATELDSLAKGVGNVDGAT